ncbi:phosphatase PAP2 family protein [Orbus mooreae]|uniref:phosphatase PAP2 family protein n=1 Tax=Orbus mooreae TaxID=3074107 RepID=UPI00370D5E91
MKLKTLSKIITSLIVVSVSYQSYAADVANRTINATKLLRNFSTLNNSVTGQEILRQNLATTLAVNNNSSEAQRQQAIYDNTLAGLVGSMSNGLLVADAMGPTMSKIYAEQNSIERNYTAKTFSPNFQNLFLQVNSFIQIESGFAKNYLANGTSDGKTIYLDNFLPSGGIQNVYDAAYHPLDEYKNPSGNSRPIQVVAGKDPQTDGKVESFTGNDFFGDQTDSSKDILPTVSSNASFPSGHSAFGFTSTLLFAQLLPEKFQDFALRGSEYGNSRVTLGVHYALDVIGARIMTTYTVAQILNNNPDYLNQNISMLGNTIQTSGDFKTLLNNAQKDLRNMLEAGCNASIADCMAKDEPLSKEQLDKNRADYRYRLTYGLDPIGDTTLAAVVPEGAEVLIESRFPYLTVAQRREVIATTEIESGHALDDGSGWARINLFDAAGGYGSINGTVSINMNADDGGFSAYDVWNNDIAGSGSFEKNGTGTLELSGNNTFNGSTTVNEGTLVVSGSLENSNITVADQGTISGNGKIGNLILNDQATYAVDLNPNSVNQGLNSSGTISLNDNTVKVNLANFSNIGAVLGQSYQILSATNGITGQIANIANQYQFIDSSLSQSTNDIRVAFNRNAKKFADIAGNINQSSISNTIENLNTSNPLYNTVIGSSTTQSSDIRQLYTELSGQVYADVFSSLLNES